MGVPADDLDDIHPPMLQPGDRAVCSLYGGAMA
ncbi:Uncharacterised protein [Mycobacterium tuberculosis]|uniref:Uncharacterized protein n=1 Tax=Mycobacterium tuberculosis TaxID=1773 RepID=A0A655AH11_MYCTX|nr:Uncharacterised protein [Mycobacterium tuberculosis]CKU19600.1 Uncharacterised protein [Mycobacterium tuberculosis]